MTDPVNFALEQLLAAGFKLDRLELGAPRNGKANRVPHVDDKSGKKSCWYIAHLVQLGERSAVVGAYGRFVGAENFKEKFALPEKAKLTDIDRARIKREQKAISDAADLAREEAAAEAADRAREIWSKLPSCSESPYLTRKGVAAYGLARGRDGAAVVPLRNSAGAVVGLQFIQADGGKKFLTGQRTTGAFHLIGTVSEDLPLIFAEGYATAASCHMATGWPAVVCFDAGNLEHVSRVLRQKYATVAFVFAGDDDHEKKENAGRKYAPAAADKVGGSVAFPVFKDPVGRKDFNDLHIESGLDAVAALLKKAYAPHVPADAQEGAFREPWKRELVWGDDGLKVTHNNLMLILENEECWKGVIAYNQFDRTVVKRRKPPYQGEAGQMGEQDDVEMAAWFARRDTYRIAVGTTVIREAALAVAHRNAFHPVREYLSGLEWDGTQRIPTFFEDHCSLAIADPAKPEVDRTTPREVARKFSLNFFIAAVARVYRPGCKADLMLVLEGDQGAKKSTLVEVLAGGSDFYCDLATSPADKDFYQIIQGRWLVEISELASFAKAETSQIKRAVSAHTDTFRPSYGRHVQKFPRECLFFGTTNDSDWQRDATGARRYMPLWVGSIDIDKVRAIRDQLWAEAVYRFNDGETWWELPPSAKDEQEKRYTDDPWVEQIVRFVDGKHGGLNAEIRQSVTSSQLMEHALDIEVKKQDRVAQRKVGEIMRRLGWKRTQRRIGGTTRVWVYQRPETSEVSSA